MLTSAVTNSDKVIVTDARQFCVGMKIKVGTEDNTAAGYTIDAINYSTNELDLSANVVSQALGAAVIPMPLTAVTAGSVVPRYSWFGDNRFHHDTGNELQFRDRPEAKIEK